LTEIRPLGFYTVGDRPWIQHVIEVMHNQGATSIDVLLYQDPARYESFLGSGKRWGIEITCHLIHSLERPYAPLRGLDLSGPVLLASETSLFFQTPTDQSTLDFDDSGEWTGWGQLADGTLLADPQASSPDWLKKATGQRGPSRSLPSLTMRTAADVLAANQKFLAGQTPLLSGGREVEPGIWIGRNVVLHPTVQLKAPVFLGADCQIGPSTVLGPNVVVGRSSILGQRLHVEDSTVLEGSFLGDKLSVENMVVDRGLLTDAASGVRIPITDILIAGSSESKTGRWLRSLVHQWLAAALLVMLLPLALPAWLLARRKGPAGQTIFVRQPCSAEPLAWVTALRWRWQEGQPRSLRDHFLRDFLPGLAAVAAGRLLLVGVGPRSPEELEDLPSEWRKSILHAPVGLVTEALVNYGAHSNLDELYVCESFYASRQSLGRDLHLLVRYFANLLLARKA
jgi:lipopolysaccharide/colanic/teichoic acid biosynthesis glycosyltransferase